MKIAGMVVWVLTAGIGVYLLAAGIAAQRQATAGAAAAGGTPAGAAVSGIPPAGGSPLLEFTHPMLALLGLTFWIFFVMTGDRLFAWIAFGVVVATVLAGLSWVIVSRRTARRRAAQRLAAARTALLPDREPAAAGPGGGATPGFPAHLVMIHGLAATCTVALVIISAATAAHG